MKMTKRVTSILLLLAILTGMVPAGAMAEEVQTTVESDGITVEGTNSLGTLLAEEIQEEADATAIGAYNVLDLTIEDGYAIVEYDSLEEAVLVAALYTEDGLRMVASGSATVYPGETVAEIAIAGDIPEYFMASAYLLDTYDHSPLCPAYDTPMYTQEMQELLASTVDDYEADRVLNLDEDNTTNFAVYTDSIQVIEYAEGVNTVVSVDDETATYVIENADSSITDLKTGDIFAYPYAQEQVLIVKVAAITMNGNTATITGDDLELEEVFSHVKMETAGNAGDLSVDASTADEGITYEGTTSDDTQTFSTFAEEAESTWKTYINFGFEKEIEGESDVFEGSVTLKGGIGLSIDIEFSYYVSPSRQFIQYKSDVGIKAELSVTGEAKAKLSMGKLMFTFFGIGIGFEPSVQLQVSGKVESSIFAGFTIGLSYENGKGIRNLTTSPKVTSEFKIEASVFFGIDLCPTIDILNGAIVEAQLSVPIGLELKAEKDLLEEDPAANSESMHACQVCIDMELNFKAEFSAKLEFLKCSWLKVESEVKAAQVKIGDLYWSWDNDEFGWGICPYKQYRITVQVKDADGQNLSGVEVMAGQTSLGTTNSYGVLAGYLPVGNYTLIATVDGETFSRIITVDGPQKVVLNDGTVPLASGECGPDMTWALYDNGLLSLQGSGNMNTYPTHEDVPWAAYRDQISCVEIESGITSIEYYAFYMCSNLAKCVIPDSVTEGGGFYGCASLTEIVLSNSQQMLGMAYFSGCSSLTELVIPSSVTYIAYQAFWYCSSLQSVMFLGNRPTIMSNAFDSVPQGTIGYYPAGDDTWTELVESTTMFPRITWVPYTPGDDGVSTIGETADDGIALLSVWDGEYETEVTDDYTLKTATFSGLIPGEEYVLLDMVSLAVEDQLAADNLLCIAQDTADADGNLVFTYVQRVDTETSYVMACGASHNNLEDATITFPEMLSGEELQAVEPTVVYDGVTLTEGVDYVITGTVDYTAAGKFTCDIRGIHDYTGTVTCSYTVVPEVRFGEKVYHNLRLQDLTKIGYAFTVETEETVDEYGVLIWTEETQEEVTVDTEGVQIQLLTYDSGYYTAESNGIYAQQLDVLHYAKPYVKINGLYVYGSVDVYSPLSYAQAVLEGTDTQLQKLVIDLLNYGAYAQLYFAETNAEAAPDTLIHDILTDEQKTLAWSDTLKAAAPEVTKDTANTLDAVWYGTNLNLLEAIQMNMAATGHIAGMYYWTETDYDSIETPDGSNASGEAVIRTDGGYTIGGITGIAAQSVYDRYYVCCYDESGNLGAIRADSVAAYATRLIEYAASTEATVNMAKALLIYGDRAAEYFAQDH